MWEESIYRVFSRNCDSRIENPFGLCVLVHMMCGCSVRTSVFIICAADMCSGCCI